MPRGQHRHPLDIPEDLWRALDQVAEREQIPTSVLCTRWLWEALEARTGGRVRVPDRPDRPWREYPRRPRPIPRPPEEEFHIW